MPYKQKYKRKSSRRPRKSKLADKKINTLVEKRMEEIAKKEDRKNLQYYVEARCFPPNLASVSNTGVSIHQLHTDLSPIVATGRTSSQDSVDYWALTNWRQRYYNPGFQSATSPTENSQYDCSYHIRQVQAFMSFYNENSEPYQVSAALIYIPNANPLTASYTNSSSGETNRLIPRRCMLTKNNWKFAKTDSGIFAGSFEQANGGDGIAKFLTKHTILDRKTVTVPGSGPATGVANYSNPKKVVHMSLNKIYKNPKKLTSLKLGDDAPEDQELLMDNGNIYLAISNNCSNTGSFIGAQVVAGCKFSLGPMVKPVLVAQDPE